MPQVYEWVDGVLTLQKARGIVLYARYHVDPKHIPGDTEWTCAVEIFNGEYEFHILGRKTRGPKRGEIRRLVEYLESKGYKAGDDWWNRYHNDKKPKKIKL